jgi:hypothetical protein
MKLLAAVLPLVLAGAALGAADAVPLRGGTAAGALVNGWFAAGTAAGNTGDVYENRDGGHSALDLGHFPQATRGTPPTGDRGWGLAAGTRPQVTVGNSSTASDARQGGSNARLAYSLQGGLAMLHAQYRANNLFIYPEHLDHDPGRNGDPGYGDLFPANTPYVLVSQGSSASDLPFLRAVFTTLAAFRPEVKRRLAAEGLLMPAVQMILRSTLTNLAAPDDYLTGRAHPTVFDAALLDPAAMARLAQALTPDTLPPLAQLKLVSDDPVQPGRDYVDPYVGERFGETPGALAWLWRGLAGTRRVVVSADSSFDPNGKKLRFHWAVLRGDTNAVTFKPLNDAGSVMEIRLRWPERRPVTPGGDLESHRVDVACFVHNGVHWSPPAFLTWFGFDHEGRTYAADGRLLEAAYGVGHGTITVPDWEALFGFLAREADEPRGRFIRAQLGETAWAELPAAVERYRAASRRERELAEAHQAARQELTKLEAAHRDAPPADRDAAALAVKAARERTERTWPALRDARAELELAHAPVRDRLLRLFQGWRDDPEFCVRHADELRRLARAAPGPARDRFQLAHRKLVNFALAADADELRLTPLEPGRFSTYERSLLAQLNLAALVNLIAPGVVQAAWAPLYTDPKLSLPKDWRDVYRHTPDGRPLGWRRYDHGQVTDFTADGLVVTETDRLGRPKAARQPEYHRAEAKEGPEAMWAKLLYRPGGRTVRFTYSGDDDLIGRAVD